MKSKKIIALMGLATILASLGTTNAEAKIVEGATYYYTTDGSDPTTSSTRKEWTNPSTPVTITAPDTDLEKSITVKVVAVKDGFTSSDVVEKTITFGAKQGIAAPILEPGTSQTFPNRDTENYFDIKNTGDTGVNYYYTTDGTDPTTSNGTLVTGKSICLNGPDTDDKTVMQLKVIAEKDGEYSNITSLRVTYSAKTDSGDGQQDTISNPTITFNKENPHNRQDNIIAFVTGKSADVEYHYTLDGTEPTKSSPKLAESFLKMKAPESDNEETVTLWVKGFKDGYNNEISAVKSITYSAKKQDTFYVTFKDRTYKDIDIIECKVGDAIEDIAPEAPDVDGYNFIGWSNESTNVHSNMTVRAMYEKMESDVKVHNPEETLILAGIDSNEDDRVLITNSWPGVNVRVFTDEVSDDPHYDGTVNSNGECYIDVGKLDENGGSVWVSYDTSTAVATTSSDAVTFAFGPRKEISYPSRGVAQIYSLPIPSSRLALPDETTLLVRGIESGETVNVYDKDNNLIGNAKQGRAPIMEINLSEGVDETNVYVARVTPGRLESPQTELDSNVIGDTGVAQNLLNVKQQIVTTFNSSDFDDTTGQDAIEDIVAGAIALNNSSIDGTVDSFSNVDALIEAEITLEDRNTGDTLTFSIGKDFSNSDSGDGDGSDGDNSGGDGDNGNGNNGNGNGDSGNGNNGNGNGDNGNGNNGNITSKDDVTIDHSGDEWVDKVADAFKDFLDKYTPSNDSKEEDIKDSLNNILQSTTDAGVSFDVNDWDKTDSTTSNKGVLQFIVNIFNQNGDTARLDFDKYIPMLPGSGDNGNGGNSGDIKSDFDKAVEEVQRYLDRLNASNSSSKNTIANRVQDICNKYNVNSSIENWDLDKSTSSRKGSLKFDVVLSQEDKSKTLNYEDTISRKSSSSHSSSSDKDKDKDDSSSNGSSNSSSNNNTITGVITEGKPVISTDGNGNTITNSEVTDSNGKNVGNKVSSSGGGSGSFNVGNAGSVVAVYKYEPTTGKYIQLPNEFVVNGSYIQFQTEANTEYFIAKAFLADNLVLKEGWNKTDKGTYLLNGLNLVTGWKQINGKWFYMDTTTKVRIENNWKQLNGVWYYLGQEGVMQTGWLNNRGNWYYLDPWSGAMATGWKQVGGNWYYLHRYTGAMQTGWHQIGYHWFYMHTDGHMASKEYINGYYLNSDGRWTK